MKPEAWPQADLTIKNAEESSAESETKKSFWEQGNNQTIASELNKTLGTNKEWSLGYSDNFFDLQRAVKILKLEETINSDAEYKNILEKTGNPKHGLVQLKAREIMIKKLLPLVATLSKVNYSKEKSEYLADEGSGETYGIAPNNINNLAGLLILATKGQGSKNFFLKEDDYVNKPQLIDALNKKPYSDFGQMCGNLRGEELNNLINSTFENAKREDEKEYLKMQMKK